MTELEAVKYLLTFTRYHVTIKEYQDGNRKEFNLRRLHIMTNKTIVTLIERASRKGTARAYSYTGYYGEKQHIEKYRVVSDEGRWLLYHYGTLTATVTDGIGKVVYGESRSDVDSIQTFLMELTRQAPELHFYPSRDVFQVVRAGKVVDEF